MAKNDRISEVSSWVVSAVLHIVLLAILAIIILKGPPREMAAEVVLNLADTAIAQGSTSTEGSDKGGAPSQDRSEAAQTEAVHAPPQVAPPVAATGAMAARFMPDPSQSMDYTDPAAEFLADLTDATPQNTSSGIGTDPSLTGTGAGFQQLVGGMRGRGLDVVLVIDATNSMQPYVDQAKQRIRDVIQIVTGVLSTDNRSLARLRFGVVAFKDYGDDYGLDAVRYLPLTNDIDEVQKFIDRVRVSGGGDDPEPTHSALRTATDRGDMGWQAGRHNVVILVTDAPVHDEGRKEAINLARNFVKRYKGTISVIDVNPNHREALGDLAAIADAGNGSAFTLAEADAFWQYMIVSIFGERFERDVQTIVERYVESQ